MIATPAPACLGPTEPDPVGVILGTGYHRFKSPSGIAGLAKWGGGRIDILAVVSRSKGSGQFREFIRQCKAQAPIVCVWFDNNPLVGRALERYGFHPCEETDDAHGERLIGWRWDA